jgi:hypothetical protein
MEIRRWWQNPSRGDSSRLRFSRLRTCCATPAASVPYLTESRANPAKISSPSQRRTPDIIPSRFYRPKFPKSKIKSEINIYPQYGLADDKALSRSDLEHRTHVAAHSCDAMPNASCLCALSIRHARQVAVRFVQGFDGAHSYYILH